jgi:hypothetical protein
MATIADRVETLSYTPDPDRTRKTVQDITVDLKSPEQLIVGLQAYPPASPDQETLVATTHAAHELGINRFSFYNFGIMPEANLLWIKSVNDVFAAT